MSQSQTIDLDHLASAIADRLSKKPPFEDTLWSAEDCADYFRVNHRHFKERIATHHQFPEGTRFPTNEGRRTRPRWYAAEVIAWGKRYRPN